MFVGVCFWLSGNVSVFFMCALYSCALACVVDGLFEFVFDACDYVFVRLFVCVSACV